MSTILLLSDYKEVQNWLIAFLHSKSVRSIAYIMDAKKPRLEQDKGYVFKDKIAFEEAGFRVTIVDLEATENENLEMAFKDVDAIYVKGGNSFYLLNAIRKSGFDKLVHKLLDNGVIYIGESAGAYVACPTIEMAHWKHQDRDIVGMNDLTGLHLVPFLVSAHYKDELKSVLTPYVNRTSLEVKLLCDNELIIVENGNSKVISV